MKSGSPKHCGWRIGLGLVALIPNLAVAGCRAIGDGSKTGPAQPDGGPGGADYAHAKVAVERFGGGADEYWLFTPDDPRPAEAPLVVFLHGWGGVDPASYGAWIEHIVRKGRIVVFPRYQADLRAAAPAMRESAARAIRAAVERLQESGPVRPRADRWAFVGHSFGGFLAASLAGQWRDEGFAAPGVLMAVQPGASSAVSLPPLDPIPADTLALVLVGDADRVVNEGMARAIFRGLDHLESGNVELVIIRSDRHDGSELTAGHFSPLAVSTTFPPQSAYPGGARGAGGLAAAAGPFGRHWRDRALTPDALDYYGYWKLLDGLLDGFYLGQNREFALGDTLEQRFMGRHPDGVAVTPLLVED